MSAKAGVPVEEYLHTSFPDLDREYPDGELEVPELGIVILPAEIFQ